MIGKVARWGNSLAVRIPQSLAQSLTVDEGRSVRLSIENGNLIVSPIDLGSAYDLDALLDGYHTEQPSRRGGLRGTAWP